MTATVSQVLAGDAKWCVEHGRAEFVLPTLPADSVDAVCCDPPAGIGFLQKTWDAPKSYGFSDAKRKAAAPTVNLGRNPTCQTCGGRKRAGKKTKGCSCATPAFNDRALRLRDRQRFVDAMTVIFVEALRVLKPGGWAFVWALPRTSHWTATALEDAGFEVRDVVDHIFGQGWSKSDAQLKPAKECWILARKPLVGTLEQNVAFNGLGELNIDAGRVFTDWNEADRPESWKKSGHSAKPDAEKIAAPPGNGINCHPLGREPSNVAFSHSPGCERVGTKRVRNPGGNIEGAAAESKRNGLFVDYSGRGEFQKHGDVDGFEDVADFRCAAGCPVAALDAQAVARGMHSAGALRGAKREASGAGIFGVAGGDGHRFDDDSASASRFFHCFEADVDDGFVYFAKPASSEKDAGLDGENPHVTVKSIALMRHLLRLIARKGMVVLDMFCGSGTTLIAAVIEGMRAIGIEMMPVEPGDDDYAGTARARVAHWEANGGPKRPAPKADPRQGTLFDLAGGTR